MSGLLLLMIASAALEVLGIGAVLPFFGLLVDTSAIHKSPWLARLYRIAGEPSEIEFITLLAIGLFVIFVAKNLLAALLSYLQARFAFGKQASLCTSLLESYLRQDYGFHLSRNSSQLAKAILTEVGSVVNGLILPLLVVLTECVVIASVTGLLIAMEPAISIMALAIIGLIAFAIQAAIKPIVSRAGVECQTHNGEMFKWINQSIGGIKETKIRGNEAFFLKIFSRSGAGYAAASSIFATFSALPRLILETVFMGGMLLVVMIFLARGAGIAEAIPVLVLFALAAIRLLPSFNRVLSAVNTIRFSAPALAVVHRDLVEIAPTAPVQSGVSFELAALERQLSVEQLWYRYPGTENWVLRDISLTIPKGTSFGLVGATGSGKTTLADLILGLLAPARGRVAVDGVDIGSLGERWTKSIGYVPQSIYLLDDSIRRNVAYGMGDDSIDDARVWEALRLARLADKIRSMPEGLKTFVGERGVRMSGGERQRLGIARALYHEPSMLLLDEATSALDNETEQEIADTLAILTGRKTLVVIAHRLSTIRNCSLIGFMAEGRLTHCGSYENLYETCDGFRMLVRKGSV